MVEQTAVLATLLSGQSNAGLSTCLNQLPVVLSRSTAVSSCIVTIVKCVTPHHTFSLTHTVAMQSGGQAPHLLV